VALKYCTWVYVLLFILSREAFPTACHIPYVALWMRKNKTGKFMTCFKWPEFGPILSELRAELVESSWNVMAHGDARVEKWRGNKRMEWVTSKRHMTAAHRLARAVQTVQADVHSSPASSRLVWRPRRFKWTRPFRRKTKPGFCACAITFQTQSTCRMNYVSCCAMTSFWTGTCTTLRRTTPSLSV